QWLRILTSPDFTLNRNNIPNLDPHVGLFANHRRRLFKCDFVSLDPRLKSRKSDTDNSFTLSSNEEAHNVKIFENRQFTLYKLNIKDHDHPIIRTIEIPHGLHRGRNLLHSLGGSIVSDNPMLVQIDIPGILHLQGRLFKSRGCLLLVCRDDIGSKEFTIYEMIKGCSVWTVRKGRIFFFGENLSGKVVKYDLISNTISQIFDIRSNQMDDDADDYEFFPPYTVAHSPYEFILSFASV
ncbi:hypothetical protein Tco_0870564, partial [Tanacetum coccineum]